MKICREAADFVFVSVPTPMNKNGSMSLKYINEAFKNINGVNRRSDNIIILKSTVVPGTTEKLQEKFPDLNIVFSPEFLTEKSARLDFINQDRVVLGGDKINTSKVAELFNERFKYCYCFLLFVRKKYMLHPARPRGQQDSYADVLLGQ